MLQLTQDHHSTGYRVPDKPLKGLDRAVNRLIGIRERSGRKLAQLKRDAALVDAQAPQWLEFSDAELHTRLLAFRTEFRRAGKIPDATLIGALAAIREASDRKLGLRPFLVQLMGTLALHRGYLAEMATGEGKTLTAGLAAVLAGWTRKPCHVITVNDYLVERDAGWMHPLYTFCGVRVGCVTAAMEPAARAQGYASDVTYTTSKELLADFLRDRLRLGTLVDPSRRLIRRLLAPKTTAQPGLLLRGLHTAIVDEADSLLIDEAVTPLIISSPRENRLLKEASHLAGNLAANLQPKTDYQTNLRYREVELTRAGLEKVAARCSDLPGIWRGTGRRTELIRQALLAREFYLRDKHYLIEGGKIVIVDEFTGRPMPQRSWREGMHQAIEAKEGLDLSDPAETIARLSFQKFFRCFHRLSGMTGTAREAADEFWDVYGLPTVTIPNNRPCVRRQWPDRLFGTAVEKWDAVTAEIERLHATGRPILVGTRSVDASERLGARLSQRGLEFKILNAARLKEEAEIVALAGERGRITIATNMAGRGTDIRLGHGIAQSGGLHVITTERHESGRVDRQIFGRAARQGDPGSAQAFVSLEDELLLKHLPPAIRRVADHLLRPRLPGENAMVRLLFALAQRRAQSLAYRQRRGVMRADQWLEDALAFARVGSEI